jgi:hypothetical protein
MNLSALSNTELEAGAMAACSDERNSIARLLAHLGEIEERRVHLEAACPSMFDYCVRKLRMSEPSASRKTNLARLVRRFPQLLPRIERSELHLSTLAFVREHLTEENCDEVIAEIAGKSRREVEGILARRAPKPDVPSMIRKLPEPAQATLAPVAAPPPRGRGPARLAPLSPGRHKVEFTASDELRADIERARELMRHRNPSGDLEVIFAAAMKAFLTQLEKQRFRKTTRPRKAQSAEHGHVTNDVRRRVIARDGERCTFTAETGERCPERGFAQVDHVTERAKGGSGELANVRVLCAAHNRYMAEKTFGRAHVEKKIASKRRAANVVQDAQDDPFALAASALVNLGFRQAESRRALDQIRSRHIAGSPPIESILHEALRLLT